MIHRFEKVTEGLYRGGAPSPQDVVKLKDIGIKKIVSLDEDTGNKIDRTCKLLGIEHIMIPMTMNRESLLTFLSHDLKQLFINGGPTFVHCHFGKDRTGLAVALFKCKYMGMNPDDAIKEAKNLGFGIGVDPVVVKLYEDIIKSCNPDKDTNNADIVSEEREYISDNRSGLMDEGHRSSFSPYLDQTKQFPYDYTENDINEQSPTRENYQSYRKPIDPQQEDVIPMVGQYNNGAGMTGAGPLFPSGGFISD